MNDTKHTPGPWIQDEYGHVRTETGGKVVFNALTLTMGQSQEAKSNDRLIAAAPELLEALREMQKQFFALTGPQKDAWIKANQAIAKATGE